MPKEETDGRRYDATDPPGPSLIYVLAPRM